MKITYGRLMNRMASNSGFTLIEMMIVIAVMAIIMGLVGSNVMGRFQKAKVEATQIQVKQLGVVLDDFRRDCNFYPTSDEGLDALVKDSGRCKNYDPSGYVAHGKIPKDGFGNEFLYESDGNKFVIRSLGRDGKEGGDGLDKDIASDQID